MHILMNTGQNLLQSALESLNGHSTPSLKRKTASKNMARDEHGPEFDDRLIKLVQENAAIYDVSHPHYRRTPVRMAIWDNIARELGAPSRYLQTKWKNIRYNYLQEQKCLETGIFNTNIRKRRFTADLTFLKHTAFRKDVSTPGTHNVKTSFNGSDHDSSNSFMYPDNLTSVGNSTSYEVIELDHSDEEGSEYMPDVSAFLAPMNDMTDDDSPQDPYAQPDMPDEPTEEPKPETMGRLAWNEELKKEQRRSPTPKSYKTEPCSANPGSPRSNRSSPLLTPMKEITSSRNGEAPSSNNGDMKLFQNGTNTSLLSEVTIRPVVMGQNSPNKRRPSSSTPTDQLLHNAGKRKPTPTQQATISTDPIELYCLSLVDCLRAMPRSERERVKFEFSKILKDAQYTNQS